MGMTIEEAIHDTEVMKEYLEYRDEPRSEGLGVAIETMRKYQMLQADYEARLKADMVAMLTEIQLEIENLEVPLLYLAEDYEGGVLDCKEIIQQKIDKLKEVEK